MFLSEDQNERRINSRGEQQGALETPDPAQKQEMQQVCKSTPPLETVANEIANGDPRNPSYKSFMVSEHLIIEAAGWRQAERERVKRERTRQNRDQTRHTETR